MANNITHGIISNNFAEYINPYQCIIITKTIRVSDRLNNSLSISESGKKNGGIFSDFKMPAELTIFPTDCPETFAKKNQSTRPEVAYKT